MRALDAIAFGAVEMPELRRIGDLGSHLLSVSQFIMGDISGVDAMKTTIFPERPKAKVENEDIISFMMEYANGAKGMILLARRNGAQKLPCLRDSGYEGLRQVRSRAHG